MNLGYCSSFYHQQTELLKKKNAPLGLKLRLLSRSHKAHSSLIFSKKMLLSPQKEIRHLFYYGVNAPLRELKNWLKKSPLNQLIFLEDDLPLFAQFVSKPQTSFFLKHPNVHFFDLTLDDFWLTKRKKIDHFLAQPFQAITNESLSECKQKTFEYIQNQLIDQSINLNIECAEYLHVSPLFYQNSLENLTKAPQSHSVFSFQNEFKNTPAIICAAGPSLNSQAHLLHSFKNKGILFAGGRALSVLNDLNIEPDFAIGLDPYCEHYQTYRCNNYFELPFIYRLRTYSKLLSLAQGPLIYSPGAIGYPLIPWIEKELNIKSSSIQEGLNVVNFSMQVAQLMGCNPIILVGSDLCYLSKSAYSPSIPNEQNLPNAFEINQQDYSLNRGFLKKNLQNQPIFTLWKWIQEAIWMGEFARKNPHIDFYNTSIEGLPISGFEVETLEHIFKNMQFTSQDTSSKIHSILQNQPKVSFNQEKFKKTLETIYESLKRCFMLYQQFQFKDSNPLIELSLKEEKAYVFLLKHLDELFDRLEPKKDPAAAQHKKAQFMNKQIKIYKSILSKYLN